MKRSELFFSAIQVPVDFAMIILAAISAYSVRNVPEFISFAMKNLPGIMTFQAKLYTYPFLDFLKVAMIIAVFIVIIYAFEGLYDMRVTRKFWQQGIKIFSATSIGLVILIVTIFLKREWFPSRFVILSAWLLATVYVVFARYIIQSIQKWLLRTRGVGVHRVLLIGRNGKMDIVGKIIKGNINLGYRVIDRIDSASLKVIKEIKQSKGIDEIILCEPSITDDEQEKLVDYCSIHNITFKFIPTTLQTSKLEIGMLSGEPLIEVKSMLLKGWGRIMKRVFDILASLVGIIFTGWVMIIIAILIKLESKGPIIYRNERIGSDGKKFFVFKFRYMKWEYCISRENKKLSEALSFEKELIENQSIRKGPLYKIKKDPRKTKVGNIIEKLSLDELPQFFNVFMGNMSMVGPRPHQEREVEKYREYHRRLLTIKPGVTGMAQVAGRSDLDFEDEYKMDLYYIENWSLWLDVQICLKTVGVLFRKRRNV